MEKLSFYKLSKSEFDTNLANGSLVIGGMYFVDDPSVNEIFVATSGNKYTSYGTNIRYFDSYDNMAASDMKDGDIAIVPVEVVINSTTIKDYQKYIKVGDIFKLESTTQNIIYGTYDEIYALKDNFVPGKIYCITDFQQIYQEGYYNYQHMETFVILGTDDSLCPSDKYMLYFYPSLNETSVRAYIKRQFGSTVNNYINHKDYGLESAIVMYDISKITWGDKSSKGQITYVKIPGLDSEFFCDPFNYYIPICDETIRRMTGELSIATGAMQYVPVLCKGFDNTNIGIRWDMTEESIDKNNLPYGNKILYKSVLINSGQDSSGDLPNHATWPRCNKILHPNLDWWKNQGHVLSPIVLFESNFIEKDGLTEGSIALWSCNFVTIHNYSASTTDWIITEALGYAYLIWIEWQNVALPDRCSSIVGSWAARSSSFEGLTQICAFRQLENCVINHPNIKLPGCPIYDCYISSGNTSGEVRWQGDEGEKLQKLLGSNDQIANKHLYTIKNGDIVEWYLEYTQLSDMQRYRVNLMDPNLEANLVNKLQWSEF